MIAPLLARLYPGAAEAARSLIAPLAKSATDEAQEHARTAQVAAQLASTLTADAGTTQAVMAALGTLYSASYLAGIYAAVADMGKRAVVTPTLAPAIAGTDWAAWSGDDVDAAANVSGPGLDQLVANANIALWQMGQTQIDRMAQIITLGLRDGTSVDTIAYDVDAVAKSGYHADVIATTEVARAQLAGTFDIYRATGVTKFDWLAEVTACAICLALQADNPHRVGEPTPPAHVNCRCGTRAITDDLAHVGTHSLSS